MSSARPASSRAPPAFLRLHLSRTWRPSASPPPSNARPGPSLPRRCFCPPCRRERWAASSDAILAEAASLICLPLRRSSSTSARAALPPAPPSFSSWPPSPLASLSLTSSSSLICLLRPDMARSLLPSSSLLAAADLLLPSYSSLSAARSGSVRNECASWTAWKRAAASARSDSVAPLPLCLSGWSLRASLR